MNSSFLYQLDQLIQDRIQNPNEDSYTASLYKDGIDRILRKIGEEAGELIIAGKNQQPIPIREEAADLLFHLMVFLRSQNLSIQDVIDTLENRHQK